MWPESAEQVKPLRTGLTTGCCATACAWAAAYQLLTGHSALDVTVVLPRGKQVTLTLCEQPRQTGYRAYAATIKDAGDDPDVTHGAKIFTWVRLLESREIVFRAAPGVGTVTKEGLVLGVGEPAINPVPRSMITQHLWSLAKVWRYEGGFEVSVGVEDGENLALKTMNSRLGIMGGLSILGTTGIVRPFSCSAYIASIHQGVDVAIANGYGHVAATTGSTSEAAIAHYYQLPSMALIEMGDFVGAVLKYMKKNPVRKLTLCGGFGKISKLANGHLDLHSRASSIDFEQLSALANRMGARGPLVEKILKANTSISALQYCQIEGIDLAYAVCASAWQYARAVVPKTVDVEVWATDRQGNLLACAETGLP